MTSARASKKQQELLRFVDSFIKGNGYGPSYREIMRSLGYKSVSTVAIHVDNLIAKGYLRRADKSARSLEVITLQPDDAQSKSRATDTTDWKQQLHLYIDNRSLSAEQQTQVNKTLKLLGLEAENTEPPSA